MSGVIGDRAVVLGGGMAGLLAARVLADAYADVVVVDRDELPAEAGLRRGVPQGRHIHALLAGGQQALEQLFPGLTTQLTSNGAPAGDLLGDIRMYVGGHRLCRARSGLQVVHASRAFLEGHVRARVRTLPDVNFVERCDVLGLATTPDGRRVTGARVLRRADSSAEEVLDADLVVDATGRGSRAPVWLEALGYERPELERLLVDVGYATCTYRLPAGALDGDVGCLHGLTPEHPRGGALVLIEGGRWMLSLIGMLGDNPPTDPEGFVAFARSLRFPDLYEAIRDTEPLDEPVAGRFPASVRRRYDRLARLPDGFLVVGDGVCSLNPIYGQGMSVAALEALTLRRHLERGGAQPHRFFRALARVIDRPWRMAAGADLAFPGVTGRRTRTLRMMGAYVAQLQAAAAHDATLAQALVRVSGLVDPPEALLRPGIGLRVLPRRLLSKTHDRRRPQRQPAFERSR